MRKAHTSCCPGSSGPSSTTCVAAAAAWQRHQASEVVWAYHAACLLSPGWCAACFCVSTRSHVALQNMLGWQSLLQLTNMLPLYCPCAAVAAAAAVLSARKPPALVSHCMLAMLFPLPQVRARPNVITSTSGSRDLQMVRLAAVAGSFCWLCRLVLCRCMNPSPTPEPLP